MAEDTVAVDIEDQSSNSNSDIVFRREDLDQNWISSIKGKILPDPEVLKLSAATKSCSIHRVPYWLRKKKSNVYDPQLISIGPLHYEKRKAELRAMEEYKWKYLRDIVSRENANWLEDCLAAVKGLEVRARNCYSEVIPLDSDSFVEMMVLDGCFILELFRRKWEKDYDVIFQLKWIAKSLHFDLLLMENQIPFFILKSLSGLIDSSGPSPPLKVIDQALNFFFENHSAVLVRVNNSKIRIRHLLHLVHAGYVSSLSKFEEPTHTPRIPCAAKLEEAGIKFRNRPANDSDFLNIKFNEGVIEIPAIKVSYKKERKFLNLIAFEQSYLHCSSYFTAYYHFMDCLINTAKDVDILSQNGIIDNRLGSDELVASHFNIMVRDAAKYHKNFFLFDVCEKINEYSKRRWPTLRASLVHNYFNNPWAIISFLAAVLLLLLTIIQTFFTSFPKFVVGK